MKNFFTSFLGTLVALLFLFVVLIIIIFAALPKEKPVLVKNNSVLLLSLNHDIPERTPKNPFGDLDMSAAKQTGLKEILESIDKAKTDDRIKGIYLDLSAVSAGFATVEEIRNALIDFKTSKKFVISYGEIYTQKAYYLATASDKIYLNPNGLIEFKGL